MIDGRSPFRPVTKGGLKYHSQIRIRSVAALLSAVIGGKKRVRIVHLY